MRIVGPVAFKHAELRESSRQGPFPRCRVTSRRSNRHHVGPYSQTTPQLLQWSPGGGAISCERGTHVQGYLAHEKQPSPLGPPYSVQYRGTSLINPRPRRTLNRTMPRTLWWAWGVVSYGQGSPVGRYLQGYLAHKKMPPPPGLP